MHAINTCGHNAQSDPVVPASHSHQFLVHSEALRGNMGDGCPDPPGCLPVLITQRASVEGSYHPVWDVVIVSGVMQLIVALGHLDGSGRSRHYTYA